MAEVKTVKVKSWDGIKTPYVVINEDDYDKDKHTLYVEEKQRRGRPKRVDIEKS